MYERIHVIVLDSVGIGAAPDAADFGDAGSDTLGHICENGVSLPHLQRLGLGNIRPLANVPPASLTKGYALKLQEQSLGKDTMTGHWEIMGLTTETPFPTFPNGFDDELLQKIEQHTGRKVVCNLPYSGTKVIDDYAEEQLATGALIVYTSADPVLQIAAHEEHIPLQELYDICHYVRDITMDNPRVGRIIARPYVGKKGAYQRTPNRHDYALSPHGETALDKLKNAGLDVIAIGKINDIFNAQGITEATPTRSNMDGVDKLGEAMDKPFKGVSFLNLVDFDAVYGHRRDVAGYARALEEFDARMPELLAKLGEKDLLLITADHGNDPAFAGTDHTREYVPLLAYSPSMQGGGTLPDGWFADIGATICDNFGVPGTGVGTSLIPVLK